MYRWWVEDSTAVKNEAPWTIHMKESEIATDQPPSTSPPKKSKLAALSYTIDKSKSLHQSKMMVSCLLVLHVVHVLYLLLLWYKLYYMCASAIRVRITGVVASCSHWHQQAWSSTETLHKALKRNGEHGLSISAESTSYRHFAKGWSPCWPYFHWQSFIWT